MSKCDISIDFFRPDREFFTGQSIQGWVRVSVNKRIKCRGLNLNAYWKTHGRGNTTRQNYFQQNLFTGDWEVGETYEYPFEFQPPVSPQTYHGHYLNIDHFVAVRADIPWAIDARREEEFMWRVGTEMPEPGEEHPVLESGNGCLANIGLAAAVALAVAAIVLPLTGVSFFFLLLLLPALLLAFLSLRTRLAVRKLGEVQWGTLGTCYAGEAMPCILQIGPVNHVKINKITATIHGIESVVSGSGTDATTYTHELFEKEILAADAPQVTRGEFIELEPEITFPETNAFSFDYPDNKIRWTVTLAIRLAMWPDWVQTREVLLAGRPRSIVDENPNPVVDTRSLHELIEVASELLTCEQDHALIDKTIALHADKLFTVAVDVTGILPSETEFDDPEYVEGRTVQGTLSGSTCKISLQLPARYNAEVDSLVRGKSWSAKGAVIRWDSLQQRLTILGV